MARPCTFKLLPRDLDILESLFKCRVMMLKHITEFHFPGTAEAGKKRVQKLKALGFIRERARRVGEPSILHISAKGSDALREHGRLDGFVRITRRSVSERTLRHELDVMDVRAAFFRAVRKQSQLSIAEFSTWPTLYHAVQPDGFVLIQEKTAKGIIQHRLFLEVDRSTESHKVIVKKGHDYLRYYQSGAFAERHGASQRDYKRFPLRVLLVCLSEERKRNLAESLFYHSPPILTLVWLTTKEEIEDNPLGTIWRCPKDSPEVPRRPLF